MGTQVGIELRKQRMNFFVLLILNPYTHNWSPELVVSGESSLLSPL